MVLMRQQRAAPCVTDASWPEDFSPRQVALLGDHKQHEVKGAKRSGAAKLPLTRCVAQ